MKSELGDQHARLPGAINDPMLRVDATGPVSTKRVTQRLWFAHAGVGTADDVLQELMNPGDHFRIRLRPELTQRGTEI